MITAKGPFLNCLFILCIFSSCAPIVKVENQVPIVDRSAYSDDFYIFGKFEAVPDDAKIIGKVLTEGGFFTKMEYRVDESLKMLQAKATEMGGNSLQIVDIHTPSPFGSKSYDIRANVLRLSSKPDRGFELLKVNTCPKAEAPIISISRKNKVYGSGNSYPLYINREFVCSIDAGDQINVMLLNESSSALIELEFLNNLYPVTVQLDQTKATNLEVKIGLHGIPKFHFH
jgi:hypothetical protein